MIIRLLYRLIVTMLALAGTFVFAQAFGVHGTLGYLGVGAIVGSWIWAMEQVLELDDWKRGLR